MIVKTNFRTTSEREEAFGNHGDNNQFFCLYAVGDNLRGNSFPWHWHSAFEIDLVTGCNTRFDFEGNSLNIAPGNAIFINSQKIHAYQPENPVKYKTYAILFEPVLLSGQYNGEIFQKYVAPVMKSQLSGVEITSKDPMSECIKEIIRLAKEEPPYYEIRIRTQLEELWCRLMDKISTMQTEPPLHKEDSGRIKDMLNYIHIHYGEALSLEKIAAAASVGVRECRRCFQRSIRRSPMDYVNLYRVQIAAELLATTDYTVTEISERCGFSSVSYFGKVFRKQIGESPAQYRKQF